MKKKIYAVKNGRKTGIFNEWQKCFEQTDKYPDAKFQSFEYHSDFEESPENVVGSLRYAIKEAEEFMEDLVYLGESADCLEDVSWAENGFLPFGNKEETEPDPFSDQYGEEEEAIEDRDKNLQNMLMGSWKIKYWKTAADMKKCVEIIRCGPNAEKRTAASNLKRHLQRCLEDRNLDDLTVIYRGLRENNAIGYNPAAVAKFVTRMSNRYPPPKS